MIGSVLGKYRIEAELSRGGMGAVYLATHELLERSVAIKLLRPELTTSTELVTRFVNEAKAASAIRHPSIIEIFDFGSTEDGQAYLVMELLEGETLSARIAARGRLSEDEAARITRSIAGALNAAHGTGIIHRDLKPDNVFLVADPDLGERAKVLDFGIAKLADHASQAQTQTGALMGTPLYMAPEQARSAASIDHRADLYSLGCILYELVTGRTPFEGQGTGELIAMHMFTPVDPPSTHVPGLSPALERIIMRLLEKEPADRFASAAEVSDALAVLGATEARVAPPLSSAKLAVAAPSIAPNARPRRPRNALPWIAAGITVTIAAIVAVVVAVSGNPPEPAPVPVVAPVAPIAPVRAEPVSPPVPDHVTKPAPPVVVVPAPAPAPRPSRPRPKASDRTTDKGAPIEPSI